MCGSVIGNLGDLGLEKVRFQFFKGSWWGSLIPIALALQSFLAVLGLLDAFHVTYFPMIHRATVIRNFSLGFSLAPVLLLLSSITVVCLLMDSRYWEVLVLSLASLGLYLVSGLGVSVSVAVLSVMLVAVALLRFRRFQDYAFWVLVLLTGFEKTLITIMKFRNSSPIYIVTENQKIESERINPCETNGLRRGAELSTRDSPRT